MNIALEETKGLDRYDKRIEVSLLGGIFFLPLVNALSWAFLLVAFVFWMLKLRLLKINGEGLGLSLGPLDRAQLIFWGAGWASVLLSTHIVLSLQGILFFSAYFLTYFLVANNIRTRRQLDLTLNVLLVSFIIVAAFGLFQFFVDTPISFQYNRFIRINLAKMDGRRLVSTMHSANIFGGYLAFIIFLLAGLFITEKPLWGRIKNSLLVALGFFCLVFTYSRGVYVGLVFSILSLVPFIKRKKRKWLFIGLFIVGAAVLVAVSPPSVKDRLRGTFDLEQTFNKERLQSYQSAFAIIRDYPFTGIGVYTTDIVYREYKLHHLGKRSFNYIHNIYFEIAIEMGIIGLVAFILIMITALKECWTSFFKASDPRLRGLMIGLWMGLVGSSAHQMFDAILYVGQMGVFFWVILGLIASVSRMSSAAKLSPSALQPFRFLLTG